MSNNTSIRGSNNTSIRGSNNDRGSFRGAKAERGSRNNISEYQVYDVPARVPNVLDARGTTQPAFRGSNRGHASRDSMTRSGTGVPDSTRTRNNYDALDELATVEISVKPIKRIKATNAIKEESPTPVALKKRDPLPIDGHLGTIVEAIKSNLVTLISSPTGSGKSTRVPEALANEGLTVMVSTPTRTAAVSLSSYVSTQCVHKIGYAAEGKAFYDSMTKIIYATSGHVRRRANRCFPGTTGLNFVDVLILDEMHSGSLDNSAISCLWMYALRHGLKVPRLVLLSATPTIMHIEPQPVVYTVPVPTPYPVEIIYTPSGLEEPKDFAAKLAVDLLADTRCMKDLLIFAAGSQDVDEIVSYISANCEDVVVLPAYSALGNEEINKIYEKLPTGIRKVVVATNIAETAITIPDAAIVIDTMMVKEAMASNSGATRLETTLIKKDSAIQRAGRTGRTCPGTVYRLIGQNEYDELEEHRIPEIERVPLHELVMELLKIEIDPMEVIVGIPPHRVEESMHLLTKLGMIKEENDVTHVTAMGDFAPTVPLGVRNAAFLWNWIKSDYPMYPGVVIASIIDAHSNGYFFVPRRDPKWPKGVRMTNDEYTNYCQTYILKTFNHWFGQSSLHTFTNMWSSFVTDLGNLHFAFVQEPRTSNRMYKWCTDNSVRARALYDLTLILSRTYNTLRSSMPSISVNVTTFDARVEVDRAAPLLCEVYDDQAMTPNFNGHMVHRQSLIRFVYDDRRIISDLEMIPRGRIVPLATHEIVTKQRKTLGFVDIFVPYPVKQGYPNDSDSDEFPW